MGTGCVGAWWWAHARHGHLDTEPVRCLHCQGKGHMSCAHVFELRSCDAYSSTCHGPTSCRSHLQSRAQQRASGAVRPEAAMRAALLVRGLRRAVLFIVQECLGHSVRPFHTTCIRLFLISYQLHNHFETAVLGLQSLKSLVRLVALPGVVGLVALEGLLGFSSPFYPF